MKIFTNKKSCINNEEGFTLIEIIAVIIILGIMAAVAVPKFFDMQEKAKFSVIKGALSEGAVRFNHAFGKHILETQGAPSGIGDLVGVDYLGTAAGTPPGESIGDFELTWTAGSGEVELDNDGNTVATAAAGDVVITVTSCKTINTITFGEILIGNKIKIITDVDWYVAPTP